MIGRQIFGNPWLFDKKISRENLPLAEVFKVAIEHAKLFEKYFAGIKPFDIMKKHFKAYVNGFDGAKELRMQLMETENARQVEEILKEYTKALEKRTAHP
jgi:tRNA-dihydrouridine synthase